MTTDAIYEEISLAPVSFCHGDNLIVAAWTDPSFLCEGCGLQE